MNEVMPQANMPKVCISVLNWNGWEKTAKCVDSIRGSTYSNYEIVLVDNSSLDDSVEQLRQKFPELKLIVSDTNLGYAGGNRLAADYAVEQGFDLFWILNNDLSVRSDTLSNLVQAYLEHGDNNLYGSLSLVSPRKSEMQPVSGQQYYGVTDGRPDFRKIALPKGWSQEDAKSKIGGSVVTVANLDGSSFLIPTEVIRRCGFMNESFFLYSEEREYCYRLAKHQIPSLVVLSSVVFHDMRGSSRASSELHAMIRYYQVRNDLIVRRRYSFRAQFLSRLLVVFKQLSSMLISWIKSQIRARKYLPLPARTKYYLIGVAHGLLGITGKTYAPEKWVALGKEANT